MIAPAHSYLPTSETPNQGHDPHLRIECILLKFHWDMKALTEVHFQ